REILARENLMGKRRNQHPQQSQDNQDSIFAGNPFLDDLLAWRAICRVLRRPLRCDGAGSTRRQATSFYLARWRTARSRSIRRAHPPAISRLAPRLDRGISDRLDRDGLRARTLLHGTTRGA